METRYIVLLIDSKFKEHNGKIFSSYKEAKEYTKDCINENYCDKVVIGMFDNRDVKESNISMIETMGFKKDKKNILIRNKIREYYKKNKEKKRIQANAWAKANPEKIKESARKTRLKRRDSGKDVVIRQAWEARNREYILWNAAKQGAKKYEMEFTIEKSDVIIPDVCPILGIQINRDIRGRMHPNSPSLDRVDNSLGYVQGNVQVISWQANRMKCDASIDELLKFADGIRAYLARLSKS